MAVVRANKNNPTKVIKGLTPLNYIILIQIKAIATTIIDEVF